MQNEEGQITELYIPRKCSATNRLITAKDHASVQINVGHLDESGVYNGHFSTFALCGYVRAQLSREEYVKETNWKLTLSTFVRNTGSQEEYVKEDADSGLDRLWQKKKTEIR